MAAVACSHASGSAPEQVTYARLFPLDRGLMSIREHHDADASKITLEYGENRCYQLHYRWRDLGPMQGVIVIRKRSVRRKDCEVLF